MGAGEYVSVRSKSDTARAVLERECRELAASPGHGHAELAAIYVERGLEVELAAEVATRLMAHDALGAHARGSRCRRFWLVRQAVPAGCCR
jgi:vacuolar iron transporter family protein